MPKRVEGKGAIVVGGGQTRGETIGNGEARVAQGAQREEVIAARDRRVPLRRRMGTGWDVAYAALFLHSEEARFFTGVSLAVDGGEGVSWGS